MPRRRLAAALLAAGLLAAGCSSTTDATEAADAAVDTATGSLGDVEITAEVAPSPHISLALAVTVRADEPVEVRVRAQGDDGSSVEVPPLEEPATEVVVPVVGLRAETAYELEVEATAGGDTAVTELTATTGPLPDDLPAIELVAADTERVAPGVTLMNLFQVRPPEPDEVDDPSELNLGALVAVDHEGEVVWYAQAPHAIGDFDLLPGGRIVHEYNDTILRELDLLGELQGEWVGDVIATRFPVDGYGREVATPDGVPIEADSVHHEVVRLPSGNTLVLATDLVEGVGGFTEPRCGEDPATFTGTFNLIVDEVVELTPDGEVVERWPLAPHLDPLTEPTELAICGIPFDWTVPNWMYGGPDDAVDYTHGNAIEVDEANNTLIVSTRHLNALFGLRYRDDERGEAGDLLWRSGPGGDVELLGGEWHYHQHAPELDGPDHLLVYDNGNTRPGTQDDGVGGTEPTYSRAVRYELERDAAGAVTSFRQVWEHRGEIDGEVAFAPFLGDVDRLANGNVLISHGGFPPMAGGPTAQIVEVVPDEGPSGGDVVLELRVEGWNVYRAERLPTWFPGAT